MKKHPKKIIKKFTIVQKVFSIFIIMAVAAGGTYLIVNSSAQSPYTAIEASTGTLTSPATTQADSSATSGQDVQFGATSSNSALAPSVMGAYAGPTNVSGVNSIGTLLGFHLKYATEYLDGTDWAHVTNASYPLPNWQNSGYTMVWGIPILTNAYSPNSNPSVVNGSTYGLKQGAAGDFNSYFVTVAQNMVNDGFANSIIRLGWEFNGGWMPWAANGGANYFVQYWQNIVTAMRSVPGQHFLFMWNPSLGDQGQGDLTAYYPGNNYVDIIGEDIYDTNWNNYPGCVANWQNELTQTYGLNWFANFAAQNNKPMAFPEWGLGAGTMATDCGTLSNTGGQTGGGDNNYFVQQIINYINTHNFAEASVWDYGSNAIPDSSVYPLATAALVSNLQPPTPPANTSACTLSTNLYGTDTMTVSVPTAGTYTLWSRINASSATANAYMLDVDNTNCFNVGDSSAIPANNWTWVNYQNGATTTPITVQLTAGTHTLEAIGTQPSVGLDQIMLLSDSTCVPTGNGNNCGSAQPQPPVVSITAPVASATVSGTTPLSASITDTAGISNVNFEIDGAGIGTATVSPYTTNWDSTSVTNGTHTLTVIATDANNLSTTASETFTVTNNTCNSAPSVPTGLSGNSSSDTSINLSWSASTASSGCTLSGYHILRNGTIVASQSTTTFQDLNLTPKTSYSYTVEAYDSDGHVSAPTAALNITTLADTTPPTVPTNLTDSLSTTSPSTSVVLNWTASSDAVGISGYQIFRNGNLITTTSGTGTTYTDNNLTPSTTYTYQLTAVDTLGNISAKASATPATITTASPPVNSLTPNTPTNFRAMFVSSFVTYLRWNEANTTGKVSGFRIYSGSKVIDTTNSTQGFAAIFNLKEGQTYTLYVQAYYGSLNSNLSTGLTITIPNNLYGGPATSNTTTANSNLTVTPQNAPSAISLPSTVTAQLTTAATVTPAIVSNSPQGGNVAAVKYYVNNNLVATTTTAPYSYNLNTPNMLNGDYTLTAKVIYKSGSVVTSNHEIEVSNPTSFAQFRLAIQRYWLAEIIVLAVLVAAWSSYRQRIKLLNLKQDGLLASDDESKINLPNSDSTFESNEEPPKVGQIIHSEHHHNDDADDN